MSETILIPTPKSIRLNHSIEQMIVMGWSDEQLIEYKYAERVPRDSKRAREYLSSIETPEVIKSFTRDEVKLARSHGASMKLIRHCETLFIKADIQKSLGEGTLTVPLLKIMLNQQRDAIGLNSDARHTIYLNLPVVVIVLKRVWAGRQPKTPQPQQLFDHKHVPQQPFDPYAAAAKTTQPINSNTIKGNNIMLKHEEQKAPLAEITTIFGQRLDEMSEQDFLNAIERTEVQIEKLKAFKTKSKKIEQSIRKLEDDLAKIVDYYDAS